MLRLWNFKNNPNNNPKISQNLLCKDEAFFVYFKDLFEEEKIKNKMLFSVLYIFDFLKSLILFLVSPQYASRLYLLAVQTLLI